MKSLLNDLLNLFFPRLCLLCQTPLVKGEKNICLHCLLDLPYTHYNDIRGNPAFDLFAGYTAIQGALSLIHFNKKGYGQTLIHSLKYHGNKTLGYELGYLSATTFQHSGLFDSVDLLIPVPLHPQRLRQRGYNQSEWLAEGIGKAYQRPVNTTLLKRIMHRSLQTHLNREERMKNVEGLYRAEIPELMRGKHFLLVDDVCTTGATLSACAKAIKDADPSAKVSIFALTWVGE